MKIYDTSNNELCQIEINEGSVRKYELMKHDCIKLVFSLDKFVPINVGCYVDFQKENYPQLKTLGRFEATEDYLPTYNEDTGGFDYDIQLDAYYFSWKNKIIKYLPKDSGQESSWSLTESPDKFCTVIEKNLEARGLQYNGLAFHCCVDSELNAKAITLSFSSTSILDALTNIAQAINGGLGCDWWVEGNYIKFGYVEKNYKINGHLLEVAPESEPLRLELGNNIASCRVSQGQSSKATRIYAYGSDRNITKRYRKELRFTPTLKGNMFRDEYRKNITAECFDIEETDYVKTTIKNDLTTLDGLTSLSTGDQVIAEAVEPCYYLFNVSRKIKTDKEEAFVGVVVDARSVEMSAEIIFSMDVEGNSYNLFSKALTKTSTYTLYGKRGAIGYEVYFDIPKLEYYVSQRGKLKYKVEVTVKGDYKLKNIKVGTLEATQIKVSKTIEIECYGANGAYLGTNPVILNGKFVGDREEDFSWLSGSVKPNTIYYKIPSIRKSRVSYSYFTNSSKENDAVNAVVATRLMLPTYPCYIDKSLKNSGHFFVPSDIKKTQRENDVCIYTGHGFVDAESDLSENSAIEEVDTIDDVYPTKEAKVLSAWLDRQEAEKWEDDKTETGNILQVWQIETDLANFSNKYRIDDSKRFSITFNRGRLNGMTFEVEYISSKSTDTKAVLEIIRNESYTVSLPNEVLHPEEGDTFNIFNYDVEYMEEELTPQAEIKLLAETLNLIQERKRDDKTYSVTLMSDWVYNNGSVRSIALGQKVKIEGITDSFNRVIGVEHPLDFVYDSPILTIGKTSAYSRFRELQQKIDSLNYQGVSYTSESVGGTTIYLIGTGDPTEPSNSNAFSAMRTRQEIDERVDRKIEGLELKYLRKDIDDTAQGHITFNEGLTANATAHLQGGSTFGEGKASIDPQGNAILNTLQSIDFDELAQIGYSLSRRSDGKFKMSLTDLEVWGKAIFNTLQIRELSYVGGNIVLSPAASKITYAREMRDGEGNVTGWKCYLLADDGSTATFNSWKVNDQVRCKTFNIEEGVHENVSNKDYWRMVTDVSTYNEPIVNDDGYELFNGNLFAWIVIAKGNCMENSDIPSAGDTIVLMGNKTDTERQHLLLMETEGENAPRIVMYRGVNSYSLKDKNIFSVGRNGVDIVSQYFNFITASGDKVYTPNYRGNWTEGTEYYYYDEVSWMGTRWLCLVGDKDSEGNKMSTTSEPSSTNAFWQATTAILSPRLNLHHNLSAGIAKGETHTVRCSMTLGDTDITVAVNKWAVSRNTGNEADDLAWSFKDKVQNFRGEIAITWSNDNTEDDIGRGDVAEFTFSAVTSTGDIYKKVLAV